MPRPKHAKCKRKRGPDAQHSPTSAPQPTGSRAAMREKSHVYISFLPLPARNRAQGPQRRAGAAGGGALPWGRWHRF